MKDTSLNRFVEKVMAIGNGMAGLGDAAAGIVGATSANDQVVNNLRRDVLEFAREYAKPQASAQQVTELSQKLEGSLQAIGLFYGLSDTTLADLLSDLDELVDAPK